MGLLDIHKLLFNFIGSHKILFLFYFLATLILYPLHHIYIPDFYGKVINSFKDKQQSLFIF